MTIDQITYFLGLRKPQVMEVDQLENLVKNFIPFIFVDLSEKKFWGEKVDKLLLSSEKMDPKTAFKTLMDRKIDLSHPIVVVCETGKFSSLVAMGLTRKGYKNAYTLGGGLQAALSLLEPG